MTAIGKTLLPLLADSGHSTRLKSGLTIFEIVGVHLLISSSKQPLLAKC